MKVDATPAFDQNKVATVRINAFRRYPFIAPFADGQTNRCAPMRAMRSTCSAIISRVRPCRRHLRQIRTQQAEPGPIAANRY
jgi:hypothetical protein